MAAGVLPTAVIVNPFTYRTALAIGSHEAVVRPAYKDNVTVWIWSVGLTSATSHSLERCIDRSQTISDFLHAKDDMPGHEALGR